MTPAFLYEAKNKFHKMKFFLKKIQEVFFKRLFLSGRIGIFGVTLEWEAALECQTPFCFVAAVELPRCSMWLVSII